MILIKKYYNISIILMISQISYIVFLLSLATTFNHELLPNQIQRTKKLLSLYNQKLALLEQMYFEHHNKTYIYTIKEELVDNINSLPKQKYELIKRFDHQVKYLSPNYFLIQNWICDLQGNQLYYLQGSQILIEDNQITLIKSQCIKTITIHDGYQLSQCIDGYQQIINKQAQQRMWHRSLNTRQFQDKIIEIYEGKVYIVGKQQNIALSNFNLVNEVVFKAYSLNQYKIQIVSNYRISVFNIRSMQIIENHWFANMTQDEDEDDQINKRDDFEMGICHCKSEGSIYVLFTNGYLLRYVNEKIYKITFIPQLAAWLNLSKHKQKRMQFIRPYMLFYDLKEHELLVFNFSFGKFTYLHQIKFDYQQSFATNTKQTSISFFTVNQSIKLICSILSSTFYYDLKLSTKYEAYEGNHVGKFALAILVIVGVLTYRCSQNNNNEDKINQFKRYSQIKREQKTMRNKNKNSVINKTKINQNIN